MRHRPEKRPMLAGFWFAMTGIAIVTAAWFLVDGSTTPFIVAWALAAIFVTLAVYEWFVRPSTRRQVTRHVEPPSRASRDEPPSEGIGPGRSRPGAGPDLHDRP